MGALDAFMSTWSNARSTLGEGTPQQGAQFDRSSELRQAQSGVESAAPGSRWTGAAADSYADANSKQGRVLGQMAGLDQRLGVEVDRSAAVVAAGRQNLDQVKLWVMDAASTVPQGVDREQALMPIARKGIGDVVDVVRQTNNDLNAIGARIQTIGNEYQALGDDKDGKKPDERPSNVVGDRNGDNEPWRYPWDPPPPHDSAPGGGRWDVDNQPYPPGPGGGPPMGPFPVPQPGHRDVNPPRVGPTSGLQDVAPTAPNGWGVNPPITLQEEYRFRLVGEQFNGASDHVRWVQRDGMWYQAKWIDYQFEGEHLTVPKGNTGMTGGLPQIPIGLNEWHPMTIQEIYAAQAQNQRLTFYLPDICGQPYVISPKTPSMTAG
ncbi:EspA/EspE family type VII secretion system effector [Mycobacterium shimoidei]|uniref:ESX-1 secretion-associated protein EspA/EspE-like domain-containing protein n=1 Tax=Mycobacterium shimoidei TaxID=29313 RepID=A0A1E3TM37_MYCSH|nr:EspA/EspE family type VII secretion system effector [Mycobacterium shimoidei]MCV7259902.1 hypothetical protein [Mycobacterium shimoidei]ODR15052.1 hypothetical protein BHQ16_03210 [Mycobacterium shimoidei]ORW79217.1 hypothetical protein AWC26_16625 [Mycobacterium shimoidei]SRX94550.1 hypothetical protein MSP7336_02807 [Mycobacterium shimoidei]